MRAKEIAILFFIISVLVFYIFSEKSEKVHYHLPQLKSIRGEDISRLVLKKGDREVILVKKNDRWYLADKGYPADRAKVDRMINTLAEITLTALVSESGNYTIYELDEDHRIDVTAYIGEEIVRRIAIGKPAPSYKHTFVLVGDDRRVYHASGNFRYDFDRDADSLRDMTVMRIKEDISEIHLKSSAGELKLVRTEAPVSEEKSHQGQEEKWQADDGRVASTEKVREIIDTLSNLRCDKFIEERQKDEFKSPVYVITLKGVNTYILSIFSKEKDTGKYPAVASSSDYPFYLSEWKAGKLMKDFKEILTPPAKP